MAFTSRGGLRLLESRVEEGGYILEFRCFKFDRNFSLKYFKFIRKFIDLISLPLVKWRLIHSKARSDLFVSFYLSKL